MKRGRYLSITIVLAIVMAGVTGVNAESWTTYNNNNTGGAVGNNTVNSAAVDSGSVKWFGTNGGGVAKYDGTTWTKYGTAAGLAGNTVNHIDSDSSGNKWVATGTGLSKYTGSSWTKYTTGNSGLAGNNCLTVATQSTTIWIGTYSNGVSKYDGTTWTTYTSANSGLANNRVLDAVVDGSGNKWFATLTGANKYDGTTWVKYTSANSGLADNSVKAVALAPNGDIWFGTAGGVNRFNGSSWTTYTTAQGLAENDTSAIDVASDGTVWAGHTGSGVSKFTGSTPWTVYTTANGLANNNVNGIDTESPTIVWFATGGGGVTKYDFTPPPPDAQFSGSPTSGNKPLTVNFTDSSTGTVTSWSWTFGDSGTSTQQSPSHQYQNAGTYTVALTVTGPTGTDTETKTNYITVTDVPPPTANFYGSPTSGYKPLTVNFTDTSTGSITAWSWTFGDSGTSTQQNPSHQYQNAGTYTVSLTATGPGGSNVNSKSNYITVNNIPAPVANFTGSPTSGNRPLTVNFTDTSTGSITSWSWTFGDTGTSNNQNPSHGYNDPGSYTVSLTVRGPGGSDVETKSNYITVTAPPPEPNFVADKTSGLVPLVVSFTDTSTGAIDTWKWDFNGDGVFDYSDSHSGVPPYTYSTIGVYNVTLKVRDDYTSEYFSKTRYSYINAMGPQVPAADFIADTNSGSAPLTVIFTDKTTGTDVSGWSWNFGDSGTSTAQNPTHVYNSQGTYTVALTATSVYGTDTETKTDYIIVGPAVPPDANFVAIPTSGYTPMDVNFYDISTGSITSWSWTFGDGGTSTAKSPTHTYQSNGTYSVTLVVDGPAGSDSKTRSNYIVSSTAPPMDANFTAYPRSGVYPLAVIFTDTSVGGDIYTRHWSFGDGVSYTMYSGSGNTNHIYQSTGVYTVSLTVYDVYYGADTETKVDYITVNTPSAPVTDFTGSPTSGVLPLNVAFSNTTTGNVTSWSWNFGDSTTSTVKNPSHTYQSGGNYTVSLTAYGPGGSNVKTRSNYIAVSTPAAPVAGFTGSPTSGGVPLVVNFTDSSTGSITAWSWNFGDGTTKTVDFPGFTHTYSSQGTYTVSLKVIGPGGSDTKNRTNYITVGTPTVPVAAFYALPVSGNPPLTVNFTDQSQGNITGWSWNFGDGYSSTQQNPSHQYTAVGVYTTSLTTTGPSGSDTETEPNFITVSNFSMIETWTTYNNNNTGGAIGNNNILGAAIENSAVRWFGTNGGGLAKYDGTTWTKYTTGNSGLANNTVYDITFDGSGNKWVATNGGVNKYTGTSWTKYTTANSAIAHNNTRAIAVDNSGDIWVCTNTSGICKFNGSSWTKYNSTNSGLANNATRDVTVDSSNNKWIATSAGVSKYDNTTWTTYGKPPLASLDTRQIAIAPNGNLWFATASGVNKFNGSSWVTYTQSDGLAKNDTLSIAVDNMGYVWAGSNGSGASKFMGSTPWTVYTTTNGLASNTVNVIAAESSMKVWFGTTSGVSLLSGTVPPHAATVPAALTIYMDIGGLTSKTVALYNTGENALTFNYSGTGSPGGQGGVIGEGGAGILSKNKGVHLGNPHYADVVPDENDMFKHPHAAGRLIVGFKPGAGKNLSAEGKKALGDISIKMNVKKESGRAKKPGGGVGIASENSKKRQWILSQFEGGSDLKAIRRMLLKDPQVAYVEPDYQVKANVIPNDTQFGQQWSLRNTGQTIYAAGETYPGGTPGADISATAAWDIHTGGENAFVGIIDTGIDYTHPELVDNIWTNPGEIPNNGKDDDNNGYKDDVHGWDFCNNDSNPMDDMGHGTHVSGTIAAMTNNNAGVAGICWSAQLVALKFLSAAGYGYISDAALALEYANAMGIPITSNSWGGGGYSQAMLDAINEAGAKGYLFIAAAGNNGQDADVFPMYPAAYTCENIISVAATGRYDDLRPWSNYGASSVDLAAPGSLILSTLPGNTYDYWSGTSMATPHVTGVAALLKNRNPNATGMSIKEAILNSVDPIDSMQGKCLSNGRLNALKALQSGTAGAPLITFSPQSGTVQPGQNQTLTVTVDANAAGGGTYNTTLNLTTNDPAKATMLIPVTITVTGGYRRLSAAMTSYDYGMVVNGGSKYKTIRLTNRGSSTTTISAINISNSHFTTTTSVPLDVPAYCSVYVPITYTPTAVSNNSCTVTIQSNAQDNPSIVISMSAMGINLTHYDRSVIAKHGSTGYDYADYMWDIVGDSSGLIWVATESWGADPQYGGLCKFNGTSWTNYRKNNGLGNNMINKLALDSSNNIWMATGYGVSKYDRSRFTNWDWLDYPGLTYSKGIAIQNGNIIWLATRDLIRFDGTNWSTYKLPAGPDAMAIDDIAVDAAGNKWVATFGQLSGGNGVFKFDGSNWTMYLTELADANAHDISIAPNGDVWVLSENGVSKFDGTNWTVYNSDNGLPWENPIFYGEFGFGPNGVVWLAYGEGWAGGLMKFDPSTGKWTKYDCLQTAYGIAFSLYMQSPTKLWIGGFMGIDVLEIPSY